MGAVPPPSAFLGGGVGGTVCPLGVCALSSVRVVLKKAVMSAAIAESPIGRRCCSHPLPDTAAELRGHKLKRCGVKRMEAKCCCRSWDRRIVNVGKEPSDPSPPCPDAGGCCCCGAGGLCPRPSPHAQHGDLSELSSPVVLEPGAGERACLRAGESHKGPICVAGFLQCFQTQPSHVFITATPPPPASCQQHRAQLHPPPSALGVHGPHQALRCCPAAHPGSASCSAWMDRDTWSPTPIPVRAVQRGGRALGFCSGTHPRHTSHRALAACSPPIRGVALCPPMAHGQGGQLSEAQTSQDVALSVPLPASPHSCVPPWFIGGQQ